LLSEYKIAVIGMGYVGLPLSIEFGKEYSTVGYDIDKIKIQELKNGFDRTDQISENNMKESTKVVFSDKHEDLKDINIYIVTVPTPIDDSRTPNLKPLFKATEMIGQYLKHGDIVIYESTVYPGCTELDCVPILESVSNLKYNVDFTCGYSPERIVPGDKEKTLSKIKKVVSASDDKTLNIINQLYSSIISAGIYLAPSIEVAEAAKSIENAQRDINIAFVNELSLIFNKMDIDTNEVLKAAQTKWNFLPFKPGLVGGHCIGVDPYYLAHRASEFGHYPDLILAGRKINDYMSKFVANKIIKEMIKNNIEVENSQILVLGITFKPNCSDIRNTKVVDVIGEFTEFQSSVFVYDPVADDEEVKKEYGINLVSYDEIEKNKFDAIVRLVPHNELLNFDYNLFKKSNSIMFDITNEWKGKNIFSF